MAIFDRNEDRIVVRVVYDGLGNAGKSTNLRQLCNLFTLRRRSELYVPEERSGRTLFFDWMQIESGLVGGYRLRCQVITVPGQFVLRERRARLLKTADVIVLVCDSTREGVERVRRGIQRTREFMADHGHADVPFVIQANKQDLRDALPPEEVAKALGFGPETHVVPARALESVGVRETIVLALRAAADRVQKQLLQQGIEALEGTAEKAQDLYADMRKNETYDPETVALAALLDESLSGIAAAASTPRSLPEPTAPGHDPQQPDTPAVAQAPVPAPASLPPPAAAPQASDSPSAVQSSEPRPLVARPPSLLPPAVPQPPSLPPPAVAKSPSLAPPAATQRPSAPSPSRVASSAPSAVEEARQPVAAEVPPGWPAPPLQVREVPSGLIWPTVSARDLLRSLQREPVVPILDRVAQAGGDGSGKSGLVLYRVQGHCFKSNLTRRFGDVDHAREALLALVRQKQALGRRTPDGTVLAVSHEASGYWLWTVTPWLETLQARMSAAAAREDQAALSAVLLDFASAAIDALRLFASEGVLLDLHPSNLAHADGRVVYLDDEVARDRSVYPLLHALLHRVEQYGSFAQALEPYLVRVDAELRQLSEDELRRLQLLPHLMELSPRAPLARRAQERWLGAVRSVLLSNALGPSRPQAVEGATASANDPFRRSPSFLPTRPAPAPEPPLASPPPAISSLSSFDPESVTRDYAKPRFPYPPAAQPPEPVEAVAEPSQPAVPRGAGPAHVLGVEEQLEAERPAPSERTAHEAPPLPQDADNLPSGYIWPATKGRELIRRIARVAANEAGGSERDLCYRAGNYLLRTSLTQRFGDAEEARAALLSRARALVPTLGRDPNDFVLVLVPSQANPSHWLWTIEAASS